MHSFAAKRYISVELAQAKSHLSDEHFTVDGTLVEAWASQKSFQKKDGGGEGSGAQFSRRPAAKRHA